MYHLHDQLSTVKGVGPVLFKYFQEAEIFTILDLLLWIPFRYEDRRQIVTINEIITSERVDEIVTIKAIPEKTSQFFFRGKDIQTATLNDGTGKKLQAMWFRQKHLLIQLKTTQQFFFSGKISKRKNRLTLTQPVVETVSDDPIHTQGLVSVYSTVPGISSRKLRSIIHEIIKNLDDDIADPVHAFLKSRNKLITFSIVESFQRIHVPKQENDPIIALHRFALEEMIELIQHAQSIKHQWKTKTDAISIQSSDFNQHLPKSLPFSLTQSQTTVSQEILLDLSKTIPMNRILVGDVGSGKTIVASIAMNAIVKAGAHACLIAPTQLVAQQHFQNISKLFPDVPCALITSHSKQKHQMQVQDKAGFFIGTHAILYNFVKEKKLPIGLVIFDEQHRFGVSHRTMTDLIQPSPHILTMTATPIPRTMMLSIFQHLSLSEITELPANRIPTRTKIVSNMNKNKMLDWIGQQIHEHQQQSLPFLTLYVCPFIDPSNALALENVTAATEEFKKIKKHPSLKGLRVALLHGSLSEKDKKQLSQDLYQNKIDILVTTPIVEVGLDLPQASVIVIENPERFGLASLHQLRGRVGRAGQQGYCFLLTTLSQSTTSLTRLEQFSQIHSGQRLAEIDLENRGAGNLFGTNQHGMDNLKFANWSDFLIISEAKSFVDSLSPDKPYSPLFHSLKSSPEKLVAN